MDNKDIKKAISDAAAAEDTSESWDLLQDKILNDSKDAEKIRVPNGLLPIFLDDLPLEKKEDKSGLVSDALSETIHKSLNTSFHSIDKKQLPVILGDVPIDKNLDKSGLVGKALSESINKYLNTSFQRFNKEGLPVILEVPPEKNLDVSGFVSSGLRKEINKSFQSFDRENLSVVLNGDTDKTLDKMVIEGVKVDGGSKPGGDLINLSINKSLLKGNSSEAKVDEKKSEKTNVYKKS